MLKSQLQDDASVNIKAAIMKKRERESHNCEI